MLKKCPTPTPLTHTSQSASTSAALPPVRASSMEGHGMLGRNGSKSQGLVHICDIWMVQEWVGLIIKD